MKKILIGVLIITSFIIFTGCSKDSQNESSLDKILEKNNYIVVDVRTEEEYKENHVKGAVNIPYDQIDDNTKLDKNKTILVYCKSGTRSGIAYDTLKELGYDVLNLGAFDNVTLEKIS